MHDVVSWYGGQSRWSSNLSRRPSDWKEDSICHFWQLLQDDALLEGIDKIIWPYDPKSSITIKSFCQRLYDGGNAPDFPVFAISKSEAHMKVCFFAWATIKGKIPIEDVLERRNFDGAWLRRKRRAIFLPLLFRFVSLASISLPDGS